MLFQNKFCESILKGTISLIFRWRLKPALKMSRTLFFLFYLLTIFNITSAQEPIALTSDVLNLNDIFYPSSEYLFKPGDNFSWVEPDYDDSDWITADTRFLADGPEVNWNGTGWFRIEIDVDSGLVDRPIGIYLYNTGQLKLYLNGNLLFDRSTMDRFPNHISFNIPGKNLIAIRFSNPDWKFFNETENPGPVLE